MGLKNSDKSLKIQSLYFAGCKYLLRICGSELLRKPPERTNTMHLLNEKLILLTQIEKIYKPEHQNLFRNKLIFWRKIADLEQEF